MTHQPQREQEAPNFLNFMAGPPPPYGQAGHILLGPPAAVPGPKPIKVPRLSEENRNVVVQEGSVCFANRAWDNGGTVHQLQTASYTPMPMTISQVDPYFKLGGTAAQTRADDMGTMNFPSTSSCGVLSSGLDAGTLLVPFQQAGPRVPNPNFRGRWCPNTAGAKRPWPYWQQSAPPRNPSVCNVSQYDPNLHGGRCTLVAGEQDNEDAFAEKLVAYARFNRNNRLIQTVLSDTVLPDPRHVVGQTRLDALRRQVKALEAHYTKCVAEVEEVEKTCAERKQKYLEAKAKFETQYSEMCKPAPGCRSVNVGTYVGWKTFIDFFVKHYNSLKEASKLHQNGTVTSQPSNQRQDSQGLNSTAVTITSKTVVDHKKSQETSETSLDLEQDCTNPEADLTAPDGTETELVGDPSSMEQTQSLFPMSTSGNSDPTSENEQEFQLQ